MSAKLSLRKEYYQHCIKGDLRSAIKTVTSRAAQSAADKRFQQNVNDRFIKLRLPPIRGTKDELVTSLVSLYRAYYRDALLHPKQAARLESNLLQSLVQLARSHSIEVRNERSWEHVEEALKIELRKRGLNSLWGKITPLRSLLIWKSERTKTFKVKLVGGTQPVTVVLLNHFIELGWLHYATFGRYYVGGWAARDKLFCVAKAYKHNIKSEAFRVSYLTHEAQHFWDYRKFPKLKPADLEYRAKLAELASSEEPRKLLMKFRSEAAKNNKLPHSYASWRLIRDLEAMGITDDARVLAAKLLRHDTARLKKQKR